jgi:hypothetical protein
MSKHRDDFDDLDELIMQTRASMIAKLDATTDFDAVLADIYAKGGKAETAESAGSSPARPGGRDFHEAGTAVDEVCGHIDMVHAVLTAATQSEQKAPLLGAMYLNAARRSLQRLRDTLAKHRIGRGEALRLIAHVEHNLREADTILRAQHGLSLDDALHDQIGDLMQLSGDIAGQIQVLRLKVTGLFDDAAEPAALTPIPHG